MELEQEQQQEQPKLQNDKGEDASSLRHRCSSCNKKTLAWRSPRRLAEAAAAARRPRAGRAESSGGGGEHGKRTDIARFVVN